MERADGKAAGEEHGFIPSRGLGWWMERADAIPNAEDWAQP